MVTIHHLPITKAGLLAAIAQIVAAVVGFGIINNTEAGVVINAATGVVDAAFLVANAIHAFAFAHVNKK